MSDHVSASDAALRALVEQWREEARSIDRDGDYCCALTRRQDADQLEAALAVRAPVSPPEEDTPRDGKRSDAPVDGVPNASMGISALAAETAPGDWDEFVVSAFCEGWAACEHMGGTLSLRESWQDSHVRLQLEIMGENVQDFDSRFAASERARESALASDARFTDSEPGKAIGSPTKTSSSPAVSLAPRAEWWHAIIVDMQAASAAIDDAAGTSEYTARMVALALIARHFLRECALPVSPAPTPEDR